MNGDLLRIVLIGAVALTLFYVVTNYSNVIENQGELNVETPMSDVYDQSQIQTMPQFVPKSGSLQQPQVDASINQLNRMSNQSQFAVVNQIQPDQIPQNLQASQLNVIKQNTNILPYPQYSNNYGPQVTATSTMPASGNGSQSVSPVLLDCYPKDTVSPQELMPREDPYNTWSQVNPTTQGHLADRNFLESGHHFGINTQGNSLRNGNLQLRSDPPIAQIPVGPWMQSTIEPDTNRRALEIGGDY